MTRILRTIVTIAAALFFGIPAHADELNSQASDQSDQSDEPEDAEEPEPVVDTTLFGERWHKFGPITAECLYTGEVFNNARGGLRTNGATRYRGNVDLTLSLDTEQADWWQGGTFSVYMQQTHGRTLTPDFVGDGQYYSSIDTGVDQDFTQLAEYWYQHSFEDDLLSVKLGRQDPNENFAFADLGGDFVNSSFITLANIPMPTWPYQTLGAMSLYKPGDGLQLGGGIYDQGRDHGQWWSHSVSQGTFLIGQADYQPWIDNKDVPMTLIRLGGWFTDSNTEAVDAGSVYDGNYGFYVTIDRMLYTERDDPEQGLGTFLQYSWAPADRNQVDHTYGAGLVYRGMFDGRDTDTIGIGYTVLDFSRTMQGLTGQTSEIATELFYKARIRDWFNLQPDMQYIARPNGLERDALVVGLRVEVTL